MDTDSDVKKLMNIEEKIKQDLEDEIAVMKELYIELTNGLKQLKSAVSNTNFESIGDQNAEEVLKPTKQAIASFIQELAPLQGLDNRFANIKEYAAKLMKTIEEFKNTLSVYGSSEKAVTDFNNNIVFIFKTTIQRHFQQDMDFNKRIEESLK